MGAVPAYGFRVDDAGGGWVEFAAGGVVWGRWFCGAAVCLASARGGVLGVDEGGTGGCVNGGGAHDFVWDECAWGEFAGASRGDDAGSGDGVSCRVAEGAERE